MDNSVPPCMSQMPFNLLPHCWRSEAGNPSKSVCMSCTSNCLGFHKFLFSTASIPAGFTPRNCRDLSYWYWNSGLGCLLWGWGPLLLRYPFQFLSDTCGCGSSLLYIYAPHQYQYDFFFNSIVVGLPLSLISEWWLFCGLVVILQKFNCAGKQAVFTHVAILTMDFTSWEPRLVLSSWM